VVYTIASAMEDAGEFDSLHVRADDSAGGVGKRRRSRARSVSGAFKRSLTHYELMYMAMFAIPMVGAAALRKSLPSWLKWVSFAGFCASLFSLLVSVYPFVDVVNPLAYAAKIAGTVVVSNIAAVVSTSCGTGKRIASSGMGHGEEMRDNQRRRR